MEKVIYNIKTQKLVVLDNYNKVIPNLILDEYLIKDIDFNNLPANVFTNIDLYLGKEYEYHDFYLSTITDLLIGDYVKLKNKWYINEEHEKTMYQYISKNKQLLLNSSAYFSMINFFEWNILKLLIASIVSNHYGWEIETIH